MHWFLKNALLINIILLRTTVYQYKPYHIIIPSQLARKSAKFDASCLAFDRACLNITQIEKFPILIALDMLKKLPFSIFHYEHLYEVLYM